jgi:hypothetical protein
MLCYVMLYIIKLASYNILKKDLKEGFKSQEHL